MKRVPFFALTDWLWTISNHLTETPAQKEELALLLLAAHHCHQVFLDICLRSNINLDVFRKNAVYSQSSNAEVTIMEGIVSNEHDVAGSPFTRVTMEPEPLVDEFFLRRRTIWLTAVNFHLKLFLRRD